MKAILVLSILLFAVGPITTAAGPGALPKLAPPLPTSLGPSAGTDPQAFDFDQTYRLRFKCAAIGSQPTSYNNSATRCPADVVDPMDIMSQPVLLVDPADPSIQAFNALHGGAGVRLAGDGKPNNHSRDNHLHQPHTTFFTTDGQLESWEDNPYYSPLGPRPSRQNAEEVHQYVPASTVGGKEIFGEDNAAVLDAQGRVYLSSLYSYRDSNTTSKEWSYAFAWWKANRANRPVDYYSGNRVWKAPQGVELDSAHLVYVPGTDRVAAIWRETNASSPLGAYVNLAWTVPGKGAAWTFLRGSERIGPCSAITNPLAQQAQIYIGCFAGARSNQSGSAGALHIHRIDTQKDTWVASHVEETDIRMSPSGANALLVDRTDGRMIIVAAGRQPNGDPLLRVALSPEGGARWDPQESFDQLLRDRIQRPPGAKLADARVNAGGFVLRSGNLHIIYSERYQYADERTASSAPEFYKALLSIHTGAERSLNAIRSLGVDVGRLASPAEASPNNELPPCQMFDARFQGGDKAIFRDYHDSIVMWENHLGHQREFIAFGDCGNVRVAEVLEENFLLFGFPAPPGYPPIPSPTPGADPAQIAAGIGTVAALMVIRMLAYKRRLAVEAPSK